MAGPPEMTGIEGTPVGRHLAYIPGLDGLRAIAVGIVILGHGDSQLVADPGVGVDIFFVLSGFLITRILLQEWRLTGTISLSNFYIRRALRLMPALWLMVLLTGLAMWLAGAPPALLRQMLHDGLAALLYLSNWMRAFGPDLETFFIHTWSLSLEEQFYFLWSSLLLWSLTRRGERGAAWVAWTAFVFITLYRPILLLSGATHPRIYNGFDTHADGCFFGCAIALIEMAPAWRLRLVRAFHLAPWAGVVALLLLIGVAVRLHYETAAYVTVWLPLTYVLAAIVILQTVVAEGFLARVLAVPPLVQLGTISYGIYLWHYPFIAGLHYFPRLAPQSSVGIILFDTLGSIGLAWLSFVLVERRFLRLKSSIGKRRSAPAVVVSAK
jgi:peptidoglycan/LPS O-acetylase OafA/YrhL